MQKLHTDVDFLVRENAVLHFVLGSIFTVIFLFSLTDKVEYDYRGKFDFKAMYIALVPAIYFMRKAFSKRKEIFKINKQGFYYYGELITNWNNFIDAVVTQDKVVLTIQDNFVLFIRYKNDEGRHFRGKFPLTNMQDKADTEIIAAIRFFSEHDSDLQKNTSIEGRV
jgi:hypothetical protein